MTARIDLMPVNPGVMHAMLGLERAVYLSHPPGAEERVETVLPHPRADARAQWRAGIGVQIGGRRGEVGENTPRLSAAQQAYAWGVGRVQVWIPWDEVTGMISRSVSAFALVAALGAAACGSSPTPASPSATPVVDASLAGAATVAISGVISDLNPRTGTFTIGSRGGSRVIRVDDRTQVWSSTVRIGVSSLQNGRNADVRGTDEGRYIQAASISVRR